MRTLAAFITMSLLAIAAPAATADARVHHCGNFDGVHWTSQDIQGAGTFDVTARGTRCRFARWLSLHAVNGENYDQQVWHVRRWTCRYLTKEYEFVDIRCRAEGNRTVRWQSGA